MKYSILLLCFALTSCTTTLAPQAMKVRTTETPEDVENCVVVGSVQAYPPYIWPGDDLKQLQNRALLIGADTVFVTSRHSTVLGIGYKCNKITNNAIAADKLKEGANKQDTYAELIRLKELFDKGIISQDEFNQQKTKILKQ